MKRLTCEMCGSTNLLKQEGVFICQACGTKYSVEDAKRMMIEGTVDVSGSTVKVDTSDKLNNLYKLARRAISTQENESALSYYETILIDDPNSWEATFFTSYLKIFGLNYEDLEIQTTRMNQCIGIVIEQIKENVNVKDQKQALDTVVNYSNHFSEIIYESAHDNYQRQRNRWNDKTSINTINADHDEFIINCYAAIKLMYCLGDNIVSYFGENKNYCLDYAVPVWDNGTQRHIGIIKKLDGKDDKNYAKNEILSYIEKIKEYDSAYQAPEISTSGCYIATAVYGSYDCPQVWTLRRFRDNTLAETWYGRTFIHIYYTISPTLVKWFGHTEWFNNIWKTKLDSMVKKLKANGVEDTPYEDRNWQ